MKPNFLVVGAERSGTTTLYEILDTHPEIFMATPKELHFFSRDENYSKGLDYYESYFDNVKNEKAVGEISASYLKKGITRRIKEGLEDRKVLRLDDFDVIYNEEDDVSSRVRRDLGPIKIIISLRNPVKRLCSQYHKNLMQGRVSTSIKTEIQKEIDGKKPPEQSVTPWLWLNHYSQHVEKWIKLFGKENVKVLIFEDWIKDQNNAVNDVLSFLDVAPMDWQPKPVHRFKSKYYRSLSLHNFLVRNFKKGKLRGLFQKLNEVKKEEPIPFKDQKWIYSLVKEDIEKTEELLGIDLSVWKIY